MKIIYKDVLNHQCLILFILVKLRYKVGHRCVHRLGQIDAFSFESVYLKHLKLLTRSAADIENGTIPVLLDYGNDLLADRTYKR